MDYNAESGHIVINSVQGELYVVDHDGTFICSDTEGHFFEVTAKGELVWEYINPVTRDGPIKTLGDVLPMVNSAFAPTAFQRIIRLSKVAISRRKHHHRAR